jgi:hypothetical protein
MVAARMLLRAVSALFLFAVVVATCELPGFAQTAWGDQQRSGRLVGDQRDCTRQCRPLYKECLPNCERTGNVPGVTKRSENCPEDCSTLVSQCLEECAKRISRAPFLFRSCR